MSTPVDSLAALADVVFDTLRMIQHAQPNVRIGSPQGIQLLVRGLAAAGVVVLPPEPTEEMVDACAEGLGYPRDNSPATELGPPDNRHLERVRAALRAALAVLHSPGDAP